MASPTYRVSVGVSASQLNSPPDMQESMILSILADYEIARGVVCPVLVEVVNFCPAWQLPANGPLCEQCVLGNIPIAVAPWMLWNENANIADKHRSAPLPPWIIRTSSRGAHAAGFRAKSLCVFACNLAAAFFASQWHIGRLYSPLRC